MRLTEQIVLLADAYAVGRGLSRSRVSTLVFNHGAKIDLMAERGADLTTRSYEDALVWFVRNWPADLAWPAGVAFPHGPNCLADAASEDAP